MVSTSRHRAWLVMVLCTAGAVVSACGGTSAVATPLSKAAAGHAYLTDLAPMNAAFAAFETVETTWNPSTIGADVAAAGTAPLTAAIRTFDQRLSSTRWPAKAVADVRTLISGDEVTLTSITALDAATDATIGTWELIVAMDVAVEASTSNLVRSDLGLPQATPPA